MHRPIASASLLTAGLATSAMLLSTAPTAAQVIRREVGPSTSMIHMSPPNLFGLRQPDFLRRDLVILNTDLELDESQRIIVETLYEDYQAAFEKALEALMPPGSPHMFTFGGFGGDDGEGFALGFSDVEDPLHDGAVVDGGPMQFIAITSNAGPGDLPPGINVDDDAVVGENGEINVSRRITVTAGGVSAGGDDGDAIEVHVETSGDMEGIPEEIRKELAAQLDERLAEITERLANGAMNAVDHEPEMIDFEALEKQMAELTERAEVFRVEKKRLRDQFVNDVRVQLTDEQTRRWPAFERKLTRIKTLPRGRLSGERTDLFKVAEKVEPTVLHDATLADTFAAYDLALDEALRARNERVEELQREVEQAMQLDDTRQAMAFIDEASALRIAVRDTNRRFADHIAATLETTDPALATTFRDEVRQTMFGRAWATTRGERIFDAALALEELTPDQRTAVGELQRTFLQDLEARNASIERLMINSEPDEPKRGVEQMQQMMSGGEFRMPEDPVRDALKDRRALEQRYVDQLHALLTPELVEQLPPLQRPAQQRMFTMPGGGTFEFKIEPGDANVIIGGPKDKN
ncbi:MAG: hypothetical protein KDA25_10620 [Phycisphaerales bacterium]|nr:hypothetical protein [Phycisphaerales bacterium]